MSSKKNTATNGIFVKGSNNAPLKIVINGGALSEESLFALRGHIDTEKDDFAYCLELQPGVTVSIEQIEEESLAEYSIL